MACNTNASNTDFSSSIALNASPISSYCSIMHNVGVYGSSVAGVLAWRKTVNSKFNCTSLRYVYAARNVLEPYSNVVRTRSTFAWHLNIREFVDYVTEQEPEPEPREVENKFSM